MRTEVRTTEGAAKFHHKMLQEWLADMENQLAPEVKAIIQEKMEAADWPLLD